MKRVWLLLVLTSIVLSGCRGYRSEKPPIHLNPNLDWQAKKKAQTLVLDPPQNTVQWGDEGSFSPVASRAKYLAKSTRVYQGKNSSGNVISRIPVPVTEAMLKRGQERFDIYCATCHDRTGAGNGMVVQKGYPRPTDLADARIIGERDGHLYDVIANGIRLMPAYGHQLDVEDRWAVVAYVRALQKARRSKATQLSDSLKNQLK